MTVERHYDDEALIFLLEGGRDQSDTHLPSCTVCREKLDSFSMIAGALHDRDVWDTRTVQAAPVPATIANLRAFADRMTAEDTAAAAILPELLAGPREEWMPRLRQHPEWRTAGVVRGLITATNRAIDTMPPDAVELTALATEIADHLDVTTQPSDTVHRLRGAAWRERGYAFFYTGDFGKAEWAVERAAQAFRMCAVADYDEARVGIVRALVDRALERVDSALGGVRGSVATFVAHADVTRTSSARIAEAHLLFNLQQVDAAFAVLTAAEASLRESTDIETHARVLSNLGYAHWKLGRIDESMRYHETVAILYEELGIVTEAARTRWNVASILAGAGRFDEALTRFEKLREVFDQYGMSSEAALVRLDVAEILLLHERHAQVEALCSAAMQIFASSGVAHTTRALVALGYMRDAARLRTATPTLVRHVRDYIRRLPAERELLFAPPPPPSL